MKLPRKSIVSYLVTLCYGTALVIPSLSWPASAFAEEGSRDKAIRRFNIKPTTPLRQAIYQGDALVSQELIKEGGQPATPIVMDYLAQQGGQWLNQFGRAKIAIQGDPLRSLQGQAALLLPIKQNEQWLWFAQGGWVQSKHRSTFSLGTGQRQFYSKQGYWGNNLFFDYQPQGNHCRLGLGLELGYQAFSNQINGYLPLSGAHLINSRADQANPARGIDIRLRYQPPQWPYWRFSVTGDHYWGTIATAGSLSLVENPTALTAGIHYTPIPLVVLGYHLRWNLPGKRVHQLSCSLNYRLGIPWEQQVDRRQAMRQSLEIDRLKLVSRHHEMVLQQQPNDEIKLEIENISPGEHQPGSTIQVRVRVATPRPLNEWQFSWVGGIPVNTQPSIKAKEETQIVTLPNSAGTYTLQLQARRAQGKIACSNTLQLKVSVEEKEGSNVHIDGLKCKDDNAIPRINVSNPDLAQASMFRQPGGAQSQEVSDVDTPSIDALRGNGLDALTTTDTEGGSDWNRMTPEQSKKYEDDLDEIDVCTITDTEGWSNWSRMTPEQRKKYEDDLAELDFQQAVARLPKYGVQIDGILTKMRKYKGKPSNLATQEIDDMIRIAESFFNNPLTTMDHVSQLENYLNEIIANYIGSETVKK